MSATNGHAAGGAAGLLSSAAGGAGPQSSTASSLSSSSTSSSSSGPLIGSVIKRNAAAVSEAVCSECGSHAVTEDHRGGVLVCTDCGVQVGGQLISEEHEWREFDDEGPTSHGTIASRVGGPEDGLYFMGLSTVMGSGPDGSSSALARLQSASTTLLDQRSLHDSLRRVARLAASLSLPQGIVERAGELYAKVLEAALFKHKRGDAVLLACIYIACKQAGVPRSLKEITQCAAEDEQGGARRKSAEKEVAKAYKKIKAHRHIYGRRRADDAQTAAAADGSASASAADMSAVSGFSSSSVASASSLIERYCSALRLPLTVEKAVRAIVDNAERGGVLEGKSPSTIVGAAIYIATQLADAPTDGQEKRLSRTWEQIATVTLTAVATLKKAYKSLHAERMSIVPSSLASPLRISQLPAT